MEVEAAKSERRKLESLAGWELITRSGGDITENGGDGGLASTMS